MSDINKENHNFRATDIMFCCVLLCAAVTICYTILSETFVVDRAHQSVADAEKLALQIADRGSEERVLAETQPESEGLIEGVIGQDAWGHAFRYKTVRSPSGEALRVAVWSSGPDGEFDTPSEIFQAHDTTRSFAFKGDDVGYVYSLR